jgi:hypothetical protein
MSSLIVPFNIGISLQSEPLRDGLIALLSNTKGALSLERLLRWHCYERIKTKMGIYFSLPLCSEGTRPLDLEIMSG